MTFPRSAGTRFMLSAVVGAGVSRLVYRVLSAQLPAPEPEPAEAAPAGARRARWWRTNYAGAPVSLFGGPAAVLGTLAGSLAAGRPRHACVIGLVGAVGLYDDLFGTSARRGLRGHLAGLRNGELTTGAVKVAGIGLAALAGAALDPDADLRTARGLIDVAVDAAVVAGTANLINLLDLRPGRACKAAAVVGLPVAAAGGPVGGALAALAATTPADLGAATMLGDCGANAAGAAVALALVEVAPRPVVVGWLTVATGLTLVSEKVSFSSVIERVSWLRRLDRAGRPPASA